MHLHTKSMCVELELSPCGISTPGLFSLLFSDRNLRAKPEKSLFKYKCECFQILVKKALLVVEQRVDWKLAVLRTVASLHH